MKSKKRQCITVNSHFNTSEKKSNTSNSDDVIGNSNLPCINIHTKISLNKLITLQKETVAKSSISINDEMTDDNNTSEEISCNKNPEELMYITCDYNGSNVLNIE